MGALCQGADTIPQETRFQIAKSCAESQARVQLAAIGEGIEGFATDMFVASTQSSVAIRTAGQLNEYAAEYASIIQTADTSYAAALAGTSWTALEITQNAFYHADTITNEALYTSLATRATAQAQFNQVERSAAIAVDLTSRMAVVQAGMSTSSGAIDVSRISRIATAQASYVASEAGKGASGAIAVANIQAGQFTSEAAIQASTTTAIAGLQANESSQMSVIRSAETTAIASIQVDAITQDAYWQSTSVTRGSQERQRGDLGDIAQRVLAISTEATLRASATISVATVEASNSLYRSQQENAGARYRAGDEYAASTYVADQGKALTFYRADQQAASQRKGADTERDIQILNADNEANTRTSVATTEQTEERYRADQTLAETHIREDIKTELLGETLTYLQGKWDDLYPLFVETQASTIRTPGYLPLPSISRRGVYTPAQVRMMQNQGVAAADVAAAGKLRDARYLCTGKGRSIASTSMEAEGVKIAVEQARAAGAVITNVGLETASVNAEALLAGQQQIAGAFLAQQQSAIEAESHNIRRQVTFLNSLAALAAGAA